MLAGIPVVCGLQGGDAGVEGKRIGLVTELVEATASPLGPALAESAKRALLMCQPFTMLKPEHYDQWKDLELKFDPQELLGG